METEAIEGLQFWLRPLHTSNTDDLAPPPHEAISDVTSIPDRLASLTNVASACAQRFQSGTSSLMKLNVENRGLCARRASGSVVHHFPLDLSQVVACPHEAPGPVSPTSHVVGIIAYATPVGFPGVDQGLVAIIVVSRLENASNMGPAGTSRALLDKAMAVLTFQGAICRRLGGCRVSAEVMGVGGFGSVRLCHMKSTDARLPQYSHCQTSVAGVRELAAKSWGPSTHQEMVLDELSNLLAAQGHPNVCRYIAATCDISSASSPVWTLIMEAYPRGNVFDMIRTDRKPFEEEYALLLTKDILGGLNHIHGKLIIHRDIKAANICLDVDGRAVIIDFGCAVHTSQAARMATPCGTPGSMAPEVLARMPYGPKVDVFACATVLYYALGGILPFTGDCTVATLRKNMRAHVRFPAKHFRGVQPCTRKIIKVMMCVLAEERPTSSQAFQYVSKVSTYIQNAQKAMPLPCAAESDSGGIESVAVFDKIVCTGGGGGCEDGVVVDDIRTRVDSLRASKLIRTCANTSRRTCRSGRLRRAMASFVHVIAHRMHSSTSKDSSSAVSTA